MKKILVLFDGVQFSEGAFEFARNLNTIKPVLTTGVFIPQLHYVNLWSYATSIDTPVFVPVAEAGDDTAVAENIKRFEARCTENKMDYRVHKSFFDLASPEVQRETRFADLLVISGERFYQTITGNNSEYIADALKTAECPVLVVPESGALPTRTILAYDGSPSSVYAIKQFAYLLPELCNNETMLVYATSNQEAHVPDEKEIEEWAGQHFPNLQLFKLDITPQKNFTTWVEENSNALLVSGSYGRSFLSQLVRKSFITEVIAHHKLPVFITHR